MGFLLTGSTIAICPHGGNVVNLTNNGRTHQIHGHPIWVSSDMFQIVGCPMPERPCRDVTWHRPSMTLFLNGSAILTSDSIATCLLSGMCTLVSYQMEFADKD